MNISSIRSCIPCILLFFLLGLPQVTHAHKVNIFAYVEGDIVQVEAYFPDGRPVVDGLVEVLDSSGQKLLEGKTDREGRFSFRAPKVDDLKLVLTASMGHKNSFILRREEFQSPSSVPAAEPVKLSKQPEPAGPPSIATLDYARLKEMMSSETERLLKEIGRLNRELVLLRQELAKPGMREVLAGIGYIFGIVGIVLYLLVRKKEGPSTGSKGPDSKS